LELEKLVNIDALTQIANRRCFNRRLDEAWFCLCTERQSLVLIMLDVDYFKAYNDHYGHLQGDACLIQVAQVLTQAVVGRSEANMVARYGGEEFVILLPQAELGEAMTIAQTIQNLLTERHVTHEASPLQHTLTLSMGIACLVPTPHQSPQILIQQADQALYQAKNKGRNQYQIFNPDV
jgi:diguanylate cyclase (GGDEF)-like protein